jgi:hypothetical protein
VDTAAEFSTPPRSTCAVPDLASDSASDVDPTDIDQYFQHVEESALQFLSNDHEDILGRTFGFKPTFAYNNLGLLSIPRYLDLPSRAVTGYSELSAFVKAVSEGVFDGLRSLRIFTGTMPHEDCAGSAVPLSPTLQNGDVLAMAARHSVKGAHVHFVQLTGEVNAQWSQVPMAQRVAVQVVSPQLPKQVEDTSWNLYKPSSPLKRLPGDNRHANLALLTGIRFAARAQLGITKFFVPCVDGVSQGTPIAVLGHAGSAYWTHWASMYLHHSGDLLGDDKRLERGEALNRLVELLDVAIFPGRMCASPGEVQIASDSVLEHNASLLPGMAGGAVVSTAEPWKLYGQQIRSECSQSRKRCWATSVRQPVYGYFYIKNVLPKLQTVEDNDFFTKVLPDIARYVRYWRESWVAWGVEDAAQGFLSKYRV